MFLTFDNYFVLHIYLIKSYKLLSSSDYIAFADEMIVLMTASTEVSNDDDASIEALHERHSEHKVA